MTGCIFAIWLPSFLRQLQQNKISVIERYFPDGIIPYDVVTALSDIMFGTTGRKFGIIVTGVLAGMLAIGGIIAILSPKAGTLIGKTRNRFSILVLWAFWAPFI